MTRSVLLWELLLIYGLLPPVLMWLKPHGWIYPLLWVLAALAYRTASRHYDYDWRKDWNRAALNRETVKSILLRFIPCALAAFLFAWVMIPDRLFSLPLESPFRWAMVMIFYPLLSVAPQEFLYRSYFFTRFAELFSRRQLIIVSGMAFGWAHVVLMNGVAVGFSALGGLLFAHTYGKTKSLAAACFEHALYGCYLFTIGMGFYFYHGQAVR